MPDFDFTAPDGKQYIVSGPEGSTPAQAFSMLQKQLGAATNSIPRLGNSADQIPLPAGAQEAMAAENANRSTYEPTFMDKVTGAGEAARSVVSGMTSGALGYIGGALGGIAGSIANGDLGTEKGTRLAKEAAEEGASKLTYQPRTILGQKYTQNVADAVNDSGVQGLPIGPEMNAMGALARPAAAQAVDALGTEAHIARNIASKVGEASVLPTIEPEKAALAQKALDMGIEIPPHALSDNAFVRMTGEFLDNLPFAGSKKEANREAFNRYLIEQIGGEEGAKALTPAVFAKAQEQAGQTIGETFRNIAVPLTDEKLVSDLDGLLQAQKRELDPTKNIIIGNVDELARIAADNGGVIPGTALKKLHSEVLAKLRADLTAHPGMKEQLSDFQGILEDAAERQITDPAIKQAYDVARVQYAKSKVLEPLVAKGGIDGVSPQALLGRMNATNNGKHRMAIGAAGDLGDAAQVAQKFMKEQPSSRTAERGFLIGAATELAGAGKAALGIGIGNIYNRFGPRIARAVIERSLAEEPITAPRQLELQEPSAFAPRAAAAPIESPYSGTLSLAEDGDNPATLQAGQPAIIKQGDQLNAPRGQWDPSAAPENGIDFPLRQEVLQQPEIEAATQAYIAESEKLRQKVYNAINPAVRAKAQRDLSSLEQEFQAGMKQLGISNAPEAHGLNRPLYQTGAPTRLEIQKTQPAGLRPPTDFSAIGRASTVEEAIDAAMRLSDPNQ